MISGTPSKPLPTPGFVGLTQLGSWLPSPLVKGEPISMPLPGIVLQFTFSVKPASAQELELILTKLTAEPGKVRYFAAMLPEGAAASNSGVSYQLFAKEGCDLGSRTVS